MSWLWYSTDGSSTEWPLGEPLPDGADIYNARFVNQFRSSINSRHLLLSCAALTLGLADDPLLEMVEPGDDAQFADGHAEVILALGNLFRHQSQGVVWMRHEGDGLPALSTEESHSYWAPDELAADAGLVWGGVVSTPHLAQIYVRSGSIRTSDGKTFLTRMSPVPPTAVSFTDFEFKAVDARSAIGGWFYEDLRAVLQRMRVLSFGLRNVSYGPMGLDLAKTKYITRGGGSSVFQYADYLLAWHATPWGSTVSAPRFLVRMDVADRRATRNSNQVHPRQAWRYPTWRGDQAVDFAAYQFIDPLNGDLSLFADLEGAGIQPERFNFIASGRSTGDEWTDLGYFGREVPLADLVPIDAARGAEAPGGWRSNFDQGRLGHMGCVLLNLVEPQYP